MTGRASGTGWNVVSSGPGLYGAASIMSVVAGATFFDFLGMPLFSLAISFSDNAKIAEHVQNNRRRSEGSYFGKSGGYVVSTLGTNLHNFGIYE